MSEFKWTEPIEDLKTLADAMRALKKYAVSKGTIFERDVYSKNFSLAIYYPDPKNKAKVKKYLVSDDIELAKKLQDNKPYDDLASYFCNIAEMNPVYTYAEEIALICSNVNFNRIHDCVYQYVVGTNWYNCYIARKTGTSYSTPLHSGHMKLIPAGKTNSMPCETAFMWENPSTGKDELHYNFKFIVRSAIENSLYYDDPANCMFDTFAFIICHEVGHRIGGHCAETNSFGGLMKKGRHQDVNIATDIIINDKLSLLFTDDKGRRNYPVSWVKRKTLWSGCVINEDLTESSLFEKLGKLTLGNKDRNKITENTSYRELPAVPVTKADTDGTFSDILGKNVTIELDIDPQLYTFASVNTQEFTLNLIEFLDGISFRGNCMQEKILYKDIVQKKYCNSEQINPESEWLQGHLMYALSEDDIAGSESDNCHIKEDGQQMQNAFAVPDVYNPVYINQENQGEDDGRPAGSKVSKEIWDELSSDVENEGRQPDTADEMRKCMNSDIAREINEAIMSEMGKIFREKQENGTLIPAEKGMIDTIRANTGISLVPDESKQWKFDLKMFLRKSVGFGERWNNEKMSKRVEGAFGATEEYEVTKKIAICIDCSRSMGSEVFQRFFPCIESSLKTERIHNCIVDVYRWGGSDISDVKVLKLHYRPSVRLAEIIMSNDMFQADAEKLSYLQPLLRIISSKKYDGVFVCTDLEFAEGNEDHDLRWRISCLKNRYNFGWVVVDRKEKPVALAEAKKRLAVYDKSAAIQKRIIRFME